MKISSLKNLTLFITGASRGIGREIALRCARDGANIVIAAKTAKPHPKLPGTIYTVAKEIEDVGGRALPLQIDVRDEVAIATGVEKAAALFGGIDILVNNASAINLTNTPDTPMKRFDLMWSVNARATFACSQACLPYLKKSQHPHILTLSPPLNMQPKWFKDCLAYTMSKYGMSLCTLGMAEEFKSAGIAVNSLWPRTTIATAAIATHFPREMLSQSRTPAIVADAAHAILLSDPHTTTGNFFVDEEVLRAIGTTDFTKYAVDPSQSLQQDFFLD